VKTFIIETEERKVKRVNWFVIYTFLITMVLTNYILSQVIQPKTSDDQKIFVKQLSNSMPSSDNSEKQIKSILNTNIVVININPGQTITEQGVPVFTTGTSTPLNYTGFYIEFLDPNHPEPSFISLNVSKLYYYTSDPSEYYADFTITASNTATIGSFTLDVYFAMLSGSSSISHISYISLFSVSVRTAPVADFIGTPISGSKPLNVQFTNLSKGSITTYAWTFGDGGTSSQPNPSYSYANAGTYNVALTATGPGGTNTNTKTNYITVTEPAPVADFTGTPTLGNKPLNVQFTNQSTGSITNYAWTFGDGGTSVQASPSYSYANAGTYNVALSVTGPGGTNTKTRTNYITVTELAPVVDFSGTPTYGYKPLNVQFTNQSTGSITAYAWTFGDGGTSSVANPSYSYTSAGTYNVELTVTGPGGSNSKTRNNYVTVNNPTFVKQIDFNIPVKYELYQNYPNPFNPNTLIKFSLPEPAYVILKIYNNLGQIVDELFSQNMSGGTYSIEWNASRVPSGIYFYRIVTNKFSETKKLLLLK
jgi:PKD repeat protein